MRRLVTARLDETLCTALRRMSRLGLRQLPVVAANSARPVGFLLRSDVLEAHVRALEDESAGSQSVAGREATRQ